MREIETARCSGDCCQVLFCPIRPDQLAEMKESGILRDGDRIRKILDGEYIGDMLIPLAARISDLPPEAAAFYTGRVEDPERDVSEHGYYYTCRHLDRVTGDCTAYEQRPSMCWEYPYGQECHYSGCTRRCEKQPDPDESLKKAPDEEEKVAVA